MTRKEALSEAIKIIRKTKINKNKINQLTEKLNLCISELPFAKWTKDAIFDACDQYIAEHGLPLRLKDFQSRELPSHPTVKNRFGMTLKEFRDTYYPLPEICNKKEYEPEQVIQEFRKEFINCGAVGKDSYNRLRSKGSPCALTVIRRSKSKNWSELLSHAGISRLNSQRKSADSYDITMHFDYEEKLSSLDNQQNS